MNDMLSRSALAAVFVEAGRPMRIEAFPIPKPRGTEAVARVLCTSICGSDLHSYFGRRSAAVPSVLGHEMVGEIVAMGPGGVDEFEGGPLNLGDRVTWSMVWSCGECFYCKNGLCPKCEKLFKFGHEEIRPEMALTGGFAEFCFLPAGTAICRVPDNVPDEVASPANCATATVAAVLRHTGGIAGETVVVLGAGMLGLSACAMAKWKGAKQVIAVEIDARRAALASRFGADLMLDGGLSPCELVAEVKGYTAGRGAECVLEFTGSPEATEAGFELLRFGGRYVLAGATYPSRPIAISAEQLVRRLIRLVGVYNYEPGDLKQALTFLSACTGRFPFGELVGRTFPLSKIAEAFAFAEAERPPRVALRP